MKQIIDGKLYDTEKAQFLGGCSVSESLFMKHSNSEYFIVRIEHTNGGPEVSYIKAISENDAKLWAMTHLTADEYISIFGEPEEE